MFRSGCWLVAAVTLRTCLNFAGVRTVACLLLGRLGIRVSLNNLPDSGWFLRESVLLLLNRITPLKAGVHGKLFVPGRRHSARNKVDLTRLVFVFIIPTCLFAPAAPTARYGKVEFLS